MDDLVAWLRERFDEDERVARAATCEPWAIVHPAYSPMEHEIHTAAVHARYIDDKNPEARRIVTNGDFNEAVDRTDAEHIVRHDPARVLREVEAKRKMLDWLDQIERTAEAAEVWGIDASDARELLAMPYADRPGYREEWNQ